MKTKEQSITLAWACATLLLLIASVSFWIEGIGAGVFWSRMTAIFITAIFLLYRITMASLIRYYALDPTGKDAYHRGADYKQLAKYKGSLQGCCEFLNNRHYGQHGLIIDQDGYMAGKKQNRKWVAKS